MSGKTVTRRRKPSAAKQAEVAARKADIELAAAAADRSTSDVQAFLARWGDRYSENNLIRLWIQCPGATQLHKFEGWFKYGRKVRAGTTAILLRQPHVSRDADKVTPDNPKGEVFHGAPWMALFDFSQTDPIDGHTDTGPGTTAAERAELGRLRAEALAVHPDTPDGTAALFQSAWAVYEARRDELIPRARNAGDTQDRD
jgi:hypothetical protein